MRLPPTSTLFPYTTLFRSLPATAGDEHRHDDDSWPASHGSPPSRMCRVVLQHDGLAVARGGIAHRVRPQHPGRRALELVRGRHRVFGAPGTALVLVARSRGLTNDSASTPPPRAPARAGSPSTRNAARASSRA